MGGLFETDKVFRHARFCPKRDNLAGTTTVASARWGRNSIGIEVDEHYFGIAQRSISAATSDLFGTATVQVTKASHYPGV